MAKGAQDMKKIRQGLGRRIRLLRKSNGLTQEQLAERAGLCYKYVGEIERGEVNPSLKSMVAVATALGVRINDLFPSENDIFPNFAPRDLRLIKEALSLLNSTFSKL